MLTKTRKIYLSPPHMGDLEREYVAEAFASNWIAPLGPHVEGFEQELADYVGVRGAVALSSGTAAIHLALRLLGVGVGDTVFCSTLTFVASANPILFQGATPVFIDSEPSSWNMSPQALKRAMNEANQTGKLPKAVVVVSLYGQSADMEEIGKICDSFGVPVIEDAAESLGATYKGKASGTFGRFGIYSFNGNKIITTSGGGMLVSDDLEALEKARYWASQAREPVRHYQHKEMGYNYRLSNVLAGIGRAQLRKLPERIEARRNIFARYQQSLSSLKGVRFMPEASYGFSTRWLTVAQIVKEECGKTAGDLIDVLEQHEIEARPVWKPLHLQPLFQTCTYYPHEEGISVSDRLFETGICLPSGSNLLPEDQERIIECIKDCLQW